MQLSVLDQLASHSIVHRDIKPCNILLSPNDPTRIVLIDFGIAYHHCAEAEAGVKDAPEESRNFCGSQYWRSVRADDGLSISSSPSIWNVTNNAVAVPHPKDDVESTFFLLVFLSKGELPWMSRLPAGEEKLPRDQFRSAKELLMSSELNKDVPDEFTAIQEYTRRSEEAGWDIHPALARLHDQMKDLAARLGEDQHAPLDWTTSPMAGEPPPEPDLELEHARETESEDSTEGHPWDDAHEAHSDSYYGGDDWEPTYERPRYLTFPPDEAELLDGQIAEITEVCMRLTYHPDCTDVRVCPCSLCRRSS